MARYLIGLSTLGLVFAVVGVFWIGSPQGRSVLTETRRAPAADFSLQGLNGKTVKLSDYDGRIRIVDFWATWCPPCRAEIPHFKALTQKYGDRGLTVIGIALDQDGPEVVRAFAQEHSIPYPLVMGNAQTVRAYGGVRSIPTTFVIDQQGRIYKKYVGYRSQAVFEKDIQDLLNASQTSLYPADVAFSN